MDSSSRTRSNTVTRLSFLEEDDGLASLAETTSGFSTNNLALQRSSSLKTLASSKIVNGRFFYVEQYGPPPAHFLDSCFLCRKTLGDRDIFMYRGDIPFCSEECRQEEIEMDEAKEKSWKSSKALRKKEQTNSSSPNKTTESYRVSVQVP